MRRNIFVLVPIAVATFLLGAFLPLVINYLSPFDPDFLFTSSEVRPVQDEQVLPSSTEKSGREIEANRFVYPDPLYKFPKTGIYFSTNKNEESQSEFQFELLYETNYKTKKIRGVEKEFKELVVEASAFDHQGIDFKTAFVEIEDHRISLKTSKVKGVHYVFDGHFIKHGYLESEASDKVVLNGVLQKFLNGKKISEEPVAFTYAVGC